MRYLTVIAALAGTVMFCGAAEAQADSVACTPKSVEWSSVKGSGDVERMRSFRTGVPDICPSLSAEVDRAVSDAVARKAAADKAQLDRLAAQQRADANARTQAQRELEAMRAELEKQRKANEELAKQQQLILQQQQAELKRLQEERNQAQAVAAAATEKRLAEEKAARDAEQKRQQQLAAQQKADRDRAQREADQQRQRQEAQKAAEWVLGTWEVEVNYSMLDCRRVGTVDFRKNADGEIDAVMDYTCKGGDGQITRFRVDADASGVSLRYAGRIKTDYIFPDEASYELARINSSRMEGKRIKIWR